MIEVATRLVLILAGLLAVASANQVSASVLFGAAHSGSDGPSTLYTIDTSTGTATPVGPIGFERCSGMDFDASGTLFATCERTDGSDTHVLITIDTSTGTGTEIGPTGVEILGFGDTVSDISFRRADGALYAYLEGGDGVGTINPVTGVATALGGSGAFCCGNGMAFSPQDVLFHSNQDDLHTLNQSTGSLTIVTSMVFSPPADSDPRINAMDFEPGTGVLFASLNDGGSGSPENHLATLDTATGLVTVIGPTVDGLDAVAFSSFLPLDHFMFYKVKTTKGTPKFEKFGPVVLTDQFRSANYDIKKPKQLGLPALKLIEDIFGSDLGVINDPNTHLKEYQIKESKGTPKFQGILGVRVVNQCSDILVDLKKAKSLLVPTNKSLVGPVSVPSQETHNLDHFLCYKAKSQQKLPKGIQVDVVDQFGDANNPRRYDLKKITKLCNPVEKDLSLIPDVFGTDSNVAIRNPEDHLVCYRAKLAKQFIAQDGCGPADPDDEGVTITPKQAKHVPILGLFVNNQFGPEQLDTKKEAEFCIPSAKNPVCGDGKLQRFAGEECDDGNTVPGDGCDANCRLECGNGVLDPGEECDPAGDDSACPGVCLAGCLCGLAIDQCALPAVITAFPFTDTIDTSTATIAPDDPFLSCGAGGQQAHSVWYTFTAPATGFVTAATFGSSYDTVLAALTGACGSLTQVACNDDFSSLQSQISFSVIAAQTYLLEVTSYDGDPGGTLVLNVSFAP